MPQTTRQPVKNAVKKSPAIQKKPAKDKAKSNGDDQKLAKPASQMVD